MNGKTLKIAVSSQKGGVGKSTWTVLLASTLHYQKNLSCVVVDADEPQHSIHVLRQRDMETVTRSDYLKVALYRQFERIHKKAYPILQSNPQRAVADFEAFLSQQQSEVDVAFFDLPGTLRSIGVINTISCMDYVFVPLKADNIVMQSSLQFAEALQEELVAKQNCDLKGIYLFWNMINKRERDEVYRQWDRVIREDKLHLMETRIPASTRYNRELSSQSNVICRSTLFAPSARQMKDSGIVELTDEVCSIIGLK